MALVVRLLAAACVLARAVSAQGATQSAEPQPAGTLRGEVIDAATAAPIVGATVTLSARPAGPVLGASPSAFLAEARQTTTNGAGVYRFTGLAGGDYVLRVQRIGYRATTIDVRLPAGQEARVSVGLTVVPIRLEPQLTRGTRDLVRSFGAADSSAAGSAASRIDAALARQRDYASTDVRELTYSDVVEAVTLGETDLFRALERLPGVSARDDFGAELWTRGGRADQTRVLFDGLALFDPHHAFGAFAAVESNALGAALLHPGVRPPSIGSGGAGVLDLHSRGGGGSGRVRGIAELSLVSARVALDRRTPDDRWAWMVAGRRTYLDWLTSLAGATDALPYHFGDVVARIDHRLGQASAIEASALVTRDALTGDAPDVAQGNRARWGNAGARVTLATQTHGVGVRHTLGASGFDARIDTVAPDPILEAAFNTDRELPLRTRLAQFVFTGDLAPTDAAHGRWSAGYGVTHTRFHFDGSATQAFTGDDFAVQPLTQTREHTYVSVWGERVQEIGTRVALHLGLRADAGAAIANGGALRPMPRVQIRYALDPSTNLSAAVGRSWQYEQGIGRPGHGGAQSLLYPSRLWMLAGADTPALRTDVATAGVERWLSGSIISSLNVYVRQSTGELLPDPRPGTVIDRPLSVTGHDHARGAELSLRKLAGRVTGSLGYTLSRTTTESEGLRFPSAQDRRHVVDATVLWHAGRAFSIGGAMTVRSGAPFTRFTAGEFLRDSAGVARWVTPPVAEQPNAERGRIYASADLMAERSFTLGRARASAFLQLRNVLRRRNDASYIDYESCVVQGAVVNGCVPGDRFERGIPLVPALGVRAVF